MARKPLTPYYVKGTELRVKDPVKGTDTLVLKFKTKGEAEVTRDRKNAEWNKLRKDMDDMEGRKRSRKKD